MKDQQLILSHLERLSLESVLIVLTTYLKTFRKPLTRAREAYGYNTGHGYPYTQRYIYSLFHSFAKVFDASMI